MNPNKSAQKKVIKFSESAQNAILNSAKLLEPFLCHYTMNLFIHLRDIILLLTRNNRVSRLAIPGTFLIIPSIDSC